MDVRVVEVDKTYGAAAALRGVSLDVRAGELLALLGPSGSGKTTLLRVIAGLEIPDSGAVFFGGEDTTALPVQKRQVGFVFQHYALFRHMTVADNIAYGLRARDRARRPSEPDIRRRVSDLLDLVQLTGYERRYAGQLSGGQRQRVALARALAVEPRVLLLDEPFGALDAKVRKDLRRWLRAIHDRTGQTTIFVTHDQDEALELADRVAILNAGAIEQVGSPDEVQDEPRSAFVMSFVGAAACLDGSVEGGHVHVAGRALGPARDLSGAVAVYCRPWDLSLVPQDSASLTGRVHAVRRVGGARRAEIDVPGAGRVEVDLPPGHKVQEGDEVGLDIGRYQAFPRGPGQAG